MSEASKTQSQTSHILETKVSSYDLLNSMLIAAIIVVGFVVTFLFLVWLTTAFDFSQRREPRVLEVALPGKEKPEGVADDEQDPGVEEFPEIETPQLVVAIESVTEAVSSIKGARELLSGDATQMGRGSGFGSREGGPGIGIGGIPEYKRWIINYESESIDTYAQQLSFFDIDIGVINKTTPDIWRVRDVGNNPTVSKTNRDAEDDAVHFMHKKPRMRRWDQTLARRQGIEMENTIVAQFYPEKTRAVMRQIEAKALEGTGKNVIDVRNTIFKVVPDGDGFVFTVVDIIYR